MNSLLITSSFSMLDSNQQLSVNPSVADPDPWDPYVFGHPRSGSVSRRYGSGTGSGSGYFYYQVKNSKKNLDYYYFVTSL